MSIVCRLLVRFVIGAAVFGLAACGSGPTQPPPVTTAPQIACPLDVTVSNVATTSQAATYPAPTITNGTAPVTTTCAPASGSTFPLGTTTVSCTANDAQSRQAACSFKVTLKGFAIAVTKYEAFGDSLTEGEMGRPNAVPQLIDPNNYPVRLQASFDALYPGQGITVINRGVSGAMVETPPGATPPVLPTTYDTIRQVVAADKPGAVLLLSGYNNLTNACGPGQSASVACQAAIDFVPTGLRDCIRKVRELSPTTSYIFVSTLTPPGATGSNRIDRTAIQMTNVDIKQMAAAEKVTLVDAYAAFVGHEAEYVNVDGLHLRTAGYQALADTFFAAIQKTVTQTPLFGFTAPR